MNTAKTIIQSLLEQDGASDVSVRIYDSVLIIEVAPRSISQLKRFMKVGIENGMLGDNAELEKSKSGKLAMSAVLLSKASDKWSTRIRKNPQWKAL